MRTDLTTRLKEQLASRARGRRPVHRSGRTLALAIGGVMGGLLAFFLDPQRGAARRKQLVDRTGSALRTGNRKLAQLGRKISAQRYGIWKKLSHLRPVTEIVDRPTPRDREEAITEVTVSSRDGGY